MSNALKKTMVYLGFADEEFAEQEQPAQQKQEAEQTPAPQAKAPVTPLRKATTKAAVPSAMNEIFTVTPKQFQDAQYISDNFREGIPVIMNLSQMNDADARRVVDYASGLSQGLLGKIERVTNKVFLLSPAHIEVSHEQQESEPAPSSFFMNS